jgi:hypothetical protein
MTDRNPHTERDHVLVDVKAKPSGWPSASPDLDSGRSRSATSGITGLEENPQISGLHGFRGLPDGPTSTGRRPTARPPTKPCAR